MAIRCQMIRHLKSLEYALVLPGSINFIVAIYIAITCLYSRYANFKGKCKQQYAIPIRVWDAKNSYTHMGYPIRVQRIAEFKFLAYAHLGLETINW